MKRFLIIIISVLFYVTAAIADRSPVSWSVKFNEKDPVNAEIVFSADISGDWVLYGIQLPDGGPKPTHVVIDGSNGIKLNGPLQEITPAEEGYSRLFELVLKQYSKSATLVQPVIITSYPVSISGYIEYQASNHKTCLPPTKQLFNIDITGKSLTSSVQEPIVRRMPEQIIEKKGELSVIKWKSVSGLISQLGEDKTPETITPQLLFKRGFKNGLFALCIPCLWPVILMSIFNLRRRRSSKKKLILKVLSYDITLMIIYPLAGLLIAQLLGDSIFSEINGNVYFNIAMFILFVMLAGNLFGGMKSRSLDTYSSTARLLRLSLLVLILSLSCTGTFIGQTIKESVNFDPILGPLVLFSGFILAFVTVTTILSLAANWKSETLESKYRLLTINRTVGFFILAYSLTYLSYVDLTYGYNVLSREIFLVIWIAIFGVLGVYMLGLFKFLRDKLNAPVGISVKRLLVAISAFSFCFYLIPGLWGAPLNAISTIIPPPYTQDFSLYDNYNENLFTDYNRGMAYAYEKGRPALVTFSAVGDAESRKMEASLWNFSPIRALLNKDFIIITLKTDNKEKLPQSRIVSINGEQRTVDTYGEMWTALQEGRFGSKSQPYQVILSPYGEPISGSIGYTESAKQYFEFLLKALKRHKNETGYDETR